MSGTKRFLQPIRSILENSSSGIAIIMHNGNICFLNECMEKLCGLKFLSLRGKNMQTLFPENTVADLAKFTEGHVQPRRFRMKLRNVNGEAVLPVFVSRIVEHDGVSGFLLVMQEDVRPTAKGALKKEHSSILRVIDQRPGEACFITDIFTGKVLFISRSIHSFTGWEPDDYQHGGFSFGMSLIHPDDVAEVMRVYETEVEKRNREPFLHDHQAWPTQFRYRRADGKYIRLSSETMLLERNESLQVHLLMTILRPHEPAKTSLRPWPDPEAAESIKIIDGKPYIDIEFLHRLRSQPVRSSEAANQPDLTDRELQILRLLAEGLSTEKISKNLNISTHTVSTHRKQLLRKLEARNGAELIRKAQKLGILA